MTTTPDLGIPELAQAQATPEITHNEALVLIQALLNGVIDKDLTSPPGSPTEGDAYIVGGSATGAWAGWDDHIAIYWGGSWRVVPGYDDGGSLIAIGARQEGLSVYVQDMDAFFTFLPDQGSSPVTYSWQRSLGKVVMGDPGTEGGAINVNGVTYESVGKISDIGGSNIAQFILHRHSTTLGPLFVSSRSNTDDESHALVDDGDALFELYAVGHDGTDYAIGARLRAVVDGTPGDGDMPVAWEFYTSPDGSETPVLRLKIGADGSVRYGSTPGANVANLWKNGSGVASATSVDLSGLDGDEIHVTGTATITEITGLAIGQEATLVADGAWTLEHDGTDVTIPGSDDFIAEAGDRVRIRCTSTDDVEVLWATRINGRAPFDYEEGTFTPTVTFDTVGDFSPTYTIQYGSYVKAGRMCNISHTVSMQTNAFTTASGGVRHAGLPFNASINGSEALWPCSAPFFSNYTYGASQVDLCGFVNEGTDYMTVFANRSAAGVQQWVATTNVTPSTSGMASRLSASYPT